MVRDTFQAAEPLGVLFLVTTAAALGFGAYFNPFELHPAFAGLAWAGAAGLVAIPFVSNARPRAGLAGLVAFVVLARIVALFQLPAGAGVTGATAWGAILWALLLTLTRDQDRSFRQKHPPLL